METVLCMSLEEMEWSISIAEEEEVQECGDVIFLIVMVYSRASTSTLALMRQVFGCVCGGPCVFIELLQLPIGRASTSTLELIQQVFGCVLWCFLSYSAVNVHR